MKITITKKHLTYAVLAIGCVFALLQSFRFGTHMVYYQAPNVSFHLNGRFWFVLFITLVIVAAIQVRWQDARSN